jgi:hypothetical protein
VLFKKNNNGENILKNPGKFKKNLPAYCMEIVFFSPPRA